MCMKLHSKFGEYVGLFDNIILAGTSYHEYNYVVVVTSCTQISLTVTVKEHRGQF